ncbi:MAG: sodium:solute symporter family protein [Thermoplasmata archaeon]|nr:sodium:solute symporter family protein [Thermoplasmata archaeon]
MNSSVDLVTFSVLTVLFVIVTLALGWYGYKNTKNNDEYLLGRNKTNALIIALSYGATFLSASAVIGFGGQSAVHGATMMWLCFLNLAVGVIVAFIVFGKRTRRVGRKLGASTFADLLGKIYKSRNIRLFTAILIIVMMPIYCAAVLKGGVNSLAVITGLDYNLMLIALSIVVGIYVVYGGIIAVMYNDALQAVIMFVGMIIIFIVTIGVVGIDGFEKLSAIPISAAVGTLPGFNGWTEFPDFASPEWLTLVTTFILGVGIGALTQPQLAVRYMSAKDDKTLTKSMAIGSVFILVIVGSAYTVGALSNVYFFENYGMSALAYVTSGVDFIIPTYIMEVFHGMTFGDLFVSLFLLSLLCASISTISALMHTIGAAGGYDAYSVFRSKKSGKDEDVKSIKVNRIVTVVMLVLVVVYCYIMPSDIIAKATSVFMGMTAAALLPAYVHGLYSKNPRKDAAVASIVAGTSTYLFWALFINKGTSIFLPICELLTGNAVLFTGSVMYVDALIVALPVSIIVMALVLWLKKSSVETVSSVAQ